MHFSLQFLTSLQKLHFRPCTQIPYILKILYVVHFNVLHTNCIPLGGHSPLSTNIAWISFYIVIDFPIAKFIEIVDMSCIINSLFGAVY